MKIKIFFLMISICMCAPVFGAEREYPDYLRGVIVPMVTPYRGGTSQRVDKKALARFTDYLCQTRASALFPVSGMGQWGDLSVDEKISVIKTVSEAAQGRKPILAGIGSSKDLRETERVIRGAEKARVDALVAVTPEFIRDEQPEVNGKRRIQDQTLLVNYYLKVCRLSELPWILYDSKAELEPLSVQAIKNGCPNVIGIKYREKDDMVRFGRMAKTLEDKVAVISGSENVAVDAVKEGGVGVIGSGANLYPALLAQLLDLAYSADWERANTLQLKIKEANDLIEKLGGGAQGVKKILNDVIGVRMSTENRGDTFRPESRPGEHQEIIEYYRHLNLPRYDP